MHEEPSLTVEREASVDMPPALDAATVISLPGIYPGELLPWKGWWWRVVSVGKSEPTITLVPHKRTNKNQERYERELANAKAIDATKTDRV